jgi:hypothetical protein
MIRQGEEQRFQENDAALILGPTGLAYDPGDDILFVASTADNTIFAVPQAGSRTGSSGRGAIIFQDDHLRGPLALVFAPNRNLLTANGDAVNDDPTQPNAPTDNAGRRQGQRRRRGRGLDLPVRRSRRTRTGHNRRVATRRHPRDSIPPMGVRHRAPIGKPSVPLRR